jgi:hypothetical protein
VSVGESTGSLCGVTLRPTRRKPRRAWVSESAPSGMTAGRTAVDGPSLLNKRHEQQPHVVHWDVARSEVKSFQIAAGVSRV